MTPERWKQIEELYWAAAGRDRESQAALLAKASTDVREIVQAMLAQEESDEILDRPAWKCEMETATNAGLDVPDADFGRYRIEAKIGAGGMGEVYRAWDTLLARKVAIKSIRAGVAVRRSELRFLEEARAASALNHPNIVTIYDIGSTDGRPYLAMEWVEGETLRQRLSRGPLPISDVLGIASQIADALLAAHENGILHRDLKPENIMLTEEGRAKVLDFGIAKRLTTSGAGSDDAASLTIPGAVIGTPGYMSPEQARGEKLDFRSDHFAFGAVLYEMATGQKAFGGGNAAEVQAAILLRQPERLTRLNPDLPAPLEWVVDRCLAKSPRERFSSSAELKTELQAIAAHANERIRRAEPIYNLPSSRRALIGREGELSELRELMADPDLRILTLSGPGGIGKTRMAIELARQLQGEFSGGACFVPLEKVNQPDLVATEIMRALGVSPLAGQAPETAIADYLRRNVSGLLLLLLDNFEHVLVAAGFVAAITSERLKIIVTSRAALRIYGEYEFPVPALVSDSAAESTAGSRPSAVRLFIDSAPGLRGASLEPEQWKIVSEICRRLDGLPLAIELAAARTKLLPLKTLLERLDDPLALLVGGARDLPQRQHTMRATLDWSYNLLVPEHQKLFRRMAVFVGGAGIEAVEAVCDTRQDLQVNLWEAMEALVDNSLIRRASAEDEEPRFTMLEALREYGMERLTAAGEEFYTRKAHAAYCLVLAEESAPSLRRERIGKHPLDPELPNFRAALDWLTSAGEVEWGLRLLMALAIYFFSRRLHTEARERLARLLALPGVDRYPRLRNWAQYWQTDFAFEGDPLEMTPYVAQWKRFEEAGDRQGMFQAAHRLGFNFKFHDTAQARYWAERAVEMARSWSHPAVLAGALSNLADIVKMEGDLSYAKALYLDAMHLFEQSNDQENAIWTLSHLADLARDQGKDAESQALYQKALSKFRELRFSPGIASCLHDLAGLAKAEGRTDEARAMLAECLRLYGPENVADLPRVLESLAALESWSAPELALTIAGAAASLRERFYVRVHSAGVSKIDEPVAAARKKLGADATMHWMKGWNMSVEEIVRWVAAEAKSRG